MEREAPIRKTVIITGAASGIGEATTKRFSQDPKYNPIYAADIKSNVHQIFPATEYPNVIPLEVDVRSEDQILNMLHKAVGDSGRIDVVVNAAGIMYKCKGLDSTCWSRDGVPTESFEEMERVNVHAPSFVMTRLPDIINNKGAVVINISSSKHFFPDYYHIEYHVGKTILSRMTKAVAHAGFGKEKNIRYIDVQPGNTKTNIEEKGWTKGNSMTEMTAVQGVIDWWRKHFGNDPKKVADIIYKIAEGDIKRSTVLVGLDAKLGKILFLLTYPLFILRSDIVYFGGSFAVYKLAELKERLRRK